MRPFPATRDVRKAHELLRLLISARRPLRIRWRRHVRSDRPTYQHNAQIVLGSRLPKENSGPHAATFLQTARATSPSHL